MEMNACESSHIEAHGHDAESNTLRIRFKGGKTFNYQGVDAEKYDRLRSAPSVGRFFHAEVKDHHEATQHEEPKAAAGD